MKSKRLIAAFHRLTLFIILIFCLYPGIDSKAQESSQRILFLSDHQGSPALYTMEADGTDIQKLADSIFEPGGVITGASLSPDGTMLAVSSRKDRIGHPTEEIFLMSMASGNITMLTNDGKENTLPNWSPDSRYLAYLSDGIYGLFAKVHIYDVMTQETEVLITASAQGNRVLTIQDFEQIVIVPSCA